jgi:hypothetical protein
VGFDYIHSAVDDHSRLAYSKLHPDEKATTCAAFLRRAAAFFTAHGIDRIERVLTDNAWPYRKSFAWRQALGRPRCGWQTHPHLPAADQLRGSGRALPVGPTSDQPAIRALLPMCRPAGRADPLSH